MKIYKIINKNRRLIEAVITKIDFDIIIKTFSVRFLSNNAIIDSYVDSFTIELDGHEMHKYGNALQVGNTVDVIIGRGHREWTIKEINIKEDQRRWIQNKESEEKALEEYFEMTYEEEMALEKKLIEAEKQLSPEDRKAMAYEEWDNI